VASLTIAGAIAFGVGIGLLARRPPHTQTPGTGEMTQANASTILEPSAAATPVENHEASAMPASTGPAVNENPQGTASSEVPSATASSRSRQAAPPVPITTGRRSSPVSRPSKTDPDLGY
jgi:hypothetical protein